MKRTEVTIPLPLLKHLLQGEADPNTSATLRLTPDELEHLEGNVEQLADAHTGRGEYNLARAAHHLLKRLRPQEEGARARNPRRITTASGIAGRRKRRQT